MTATIRYSVDDSGADGPAAGVTTVTDTSGGKLQTVTEWPVLEVTSSGGDTYVAVW